jgi:hypothetical protein
MHHDSPTARLAAAFMVELNASKLGNLDWNWARLAKASIFSLALCGFFYKPAKNSWES